MTLRRNLVGRAAVWVVTAVAGAATVVGCSASPGDGGAGTAASSAPVPSIHGDAAAPVDRLVATAIADLQRWWAAEYPKLYDTPYREVTGGFYAVNPDTGPLPPCAETAAEISGNAFYCGSADVVAWDAAGLLPGLRDRYGDFVIPVVIAHEWGHAVQQRANFTAATVTRELQADCFAGAWAAHARADTVVAASDSDLDSALAGLLGLRDSPGTAKLDPSAHGSGFDRVNAFQSGYDSGTQACKAFRDGDPPVVEIPFYDARDLAQGGNAPYADIVRGVPADLQDYWTTVFPTVAGTKWRELRNGVVGFDPASRPTCGGRSTGDLALFYCAADDYIGFDNAVTMPRIYADNGDYAVTTLLATRYGLAALDRAGDSTSDGVDALRSDCLAGAYTASLFLRDRPASSYHLSPGDLDKAVSALLDYRDRSPGAPTGFAAVDAYRAGVMDGVQKCFTATF